MNKRDFFKAVDRTIGRAILRFLPSAPPARRVTFPPSGKVLFIRPGGIGDAALLLASVKTFADAFPSAVIHVLCEKRNAAVFALSKNVNRIYLYESPFDLLRCLSAGYDAVIDTEQWHAFSAIVAACNVGVDHRVDPVKIGFASNEREKAFSVKIPYYPDESEVLAFLRLIEPLTGAAPDFNAEKPFLEVEPDDRIKKDTIAIFPGASLGEKLWSAEKFAEVSRHFGKKGYCVVILGSGKEKKAAEKIKSASPDCTDLAGRTTLKESCAILKSSQLLITCDSGIMHFAFAVGTPTVSLFGPTNEKKWAPIGKKHIAINKLPLSKGRAIYSYLPKNLRGMDCLAGITAEEVIRAAENLLKQDTS